MIKRKEDMELRVRENIRGGSGIIEDTIIMTPEEMLGKCRMFTRFYIDPGDSIGLHTHTDDAEIYYILKGELVVRQNGKDETLREGDVVFTANGDSHSVENHSDKKAEMLAVIFG